MSLDPLTAENYAAIVRENPDQIMTVLRLAYNCGRFEGVMECARKDLAVDPHPHQPTGPTGPEAA